MTYLQANSFLMTKGGLSLDCSPFTSMQMQGLAKTAAAAQHIFIIKHAERLTTLSRMAIAKAGGSYVVFDFEFGGQNGKVVG